MSFIRGKKVDGNVYYYEIENKRVGGKVVQEYIRYVGKDKDSSSGIPLERVQFGSIAGTPLTRDREGWEYHGCGEAQRHRGNQTQVVEDAHPPKNGKITDLT